MQMYLKDSASTFEFVLRGELTGDAVEGLEHAWITAKSILRGKDVLIDVSALTDADSGGIDLLHRMAGSGARLRAAKPPHFPEFLRFLGVVAATPPRYGSRPWVLGLCRLLKLST